MQKKHLQDVAEIFSGYLFKEVLKNDEDGEIMVIQLKNVNDDGEITLNNLFKVSLDNVSERLYLRKNDIIFKSKSTSHSSAIIPEVTGKIIASSHYLTVRITEDSVLPEYLLWYLQQDFTQDYFMKKAGRRLIRLINKKVLGELEVKIPSIAHQEQIVQLNDLFRKEKKLTLKLLKKKEQMIYGIFLKLLGEDSGK
ncbi:MAG: hypothetical protein APR63_12360 [Desulfuromonas sp. SDB]|nr:MAG: hypothetical protein APR63_12360 [Desulfuromonas sp. SDB]